MVAPLYVRLPGGVSVMSDGATKALVIVNACVAEPVKLEAEMVAVTAYEPGVVGAIAEGP